MIHYNLYGDTTVFDFSVRKLISLILKTVQKYENVSNEHVVSFIFVDNKEIHKINNDYRHIDRPTDVISFATIDESVDRTLSYELGDIYISVDKVFEQASDYGHSAYRELGFLLTHGMLHLLGYDHMKKEDELIMFKKQDEILEIANVEK